MGSVLYSVYDVKEWNISAVYCNYISRRSELNCLDLIYQLSFSLKQVVHSDALLYQDESNETQALTAEDHKKRLSRTAFYVKICRP